MRFFHENADSIVKLYINQIGVAIFSMFIYTAAGAISVEGVTSLFIKIGISAFAVFFYFALLYTVMWEIGAKDKIRIEGGRMEEKKSKGILLGLYANMPNFVFIGLALVLLGIYTLTGANALYTIFLLLNGLFRIFVSMYLGIIQGLTDSLTGNTDFLVETVLYLVFSFVSALVIHFSYLMGLKEKRFFTRSPVKK